MFEAKPSFMNKCDLTANFLKQLNTLLTKLNQHKIPLMKQLDGIHNRIELIKEQLKDSENRANEKLPIEEERECKIIYMRKKDKLIQISSPDITNETVKQLEVDLNPCEHLMNIHTKFKYSETIYLVSIEDLKPSGYVIVDAFDYDQSVYKGFVCYLSILDENGSLFIVDTLKFREDLVRVNFFGCNHKKIFTSPHAYYKCLNDFKNISCYLIYDFYHAKSALINNLWVDKDCDDVLLIDWRIRPVDKYMRFLLQTRIIDTLPAISKFIKISSGSYDEANDLSNLTKKRNNNSVKFVNMIKRSSEEKIKSILQKKAQIDSYSDVSPEMKPCISGSTIESHGLTIQITNRKRIALRKEGDILLLRHSMNAWYDLLIKYICHKFRINSSPYLEQLIKHREHIAMDHNENIFHIASNETIVKIYNTRPTSYETFIKLLNHPNCLLKTNFEGFLYTEVTKNSQLENHNFPLKPTRNSDIRGNLLDKKEYWKRRPRKVSKFTFTEDSSDLEFKEIKSQRKTWAELKKKNTNSRKVREKGNIDNLVERMGLNDNSMRNCKKKKEKKVEDVNAELHNTKETILKSSKRKRKNRK